MRHTLTWLPRIIGFAAWYLATWFRSSLRVSRVILSPRLITSPGIVRVPIRSRTDAEVTLLASLITITPETLCLSIDRSGHVLHVHGMFVESRADLINTIGELEHRFLRAHHRIPDALERPDDEGLSKQPSTPEGDHR
ncbi:Na+/H+ antiporter subunit E [Arthrobacter sp. RIT-PI-e]|uniref:Na+/H+ antiporter subunit E n=1 Tax=Arthrobacter sp. RIT-PI-e TaxID=1681197 RepID=UPI000675C0D7|nr:Na+/H+ antiporter subunit E [Arthrobacter sp. RIT-PI-e]